MKTKTLSVVIPIFNEEEVFPQLIERLGSALETFKPELEILFVNDGSTDSSRELINAAALNDTTIRGIHLSRNFGHQSAVTAGLENATGDIVVVMDADLQDPPELISEMVSRINAGDDVVYAVRRTRQESALKVGCYKLFYRILKYVSNLDIPLDSGDFSAMNRRVVNSINEMPEYNRFIRGIRSYAGFKQSAVYYDRDSRAAGEPKYNFFGLLKLAGDGVFAFSEYPLRLASFAGAIVALVSFIVGILLLFWRLFSDQQLPGFATLAVSIFFLGGVQLICTGVLGEYIGRIYNEVKRRPTYIVESKVGKHSQIR